MSMKRSVALGVMLAALVLAGCAVTETRTTNARPTAGQELIDLKAALDKGVITQGEYDQKKAQILTTR
jgi:hypothetical protein